MASTKPRPTPAGPRDRAATRARLIEAAGKVLARDGFAALGVNRIAVEAGCDKVLIYRYFGGLEGLLRAFGESGDFWPTVEELAGGDPARLVGPPPGEVLAAVLVNFARALRRRPLTLEIMAFETVTRNELTAILEEVRERRSTALVAALGLTPATGPDLLAVTALLSAGISYLAVRARKIRLYGGIEIASEAAWTRLEAGLVTLARAALT